jgi:hypothetical protein
VLLLSGILMATTLSPHIDMIAVTGYLGLAWWCSPPPRS